MGLMANAEMLLPYDQSRADLLFARRRKSRGGQPPRRHPAETRLTPPGPPRWSPKISRGAIIVGGSMLIMAGGAALLKPWTWFTSLDQEDPEEDLGKQKLNAELDQPPDSPIKTLLLNRVKPLYGPNPPKSLNYAGLEVKVSIPKVILKTENTKRVSGLFTPRDSSYTTPEPLYPTRATRLRIPYLGLVLASEKIDIPAENLAEDGTPLVDIDFPIDKALYEGFSPVMTITTPHPSIIKPGSRQLYKNFERFVYIKEACSALLVDILVEETVKKMHSLGLNITLEARTPGGTRRQAEALTQSLMIINNAQGRFAAVIDLAGYLLAYKAIEGTDVDDPNNMDPSFARVRPSMKAVNLGISPQDILYNSFHWVLTTPAASREFAHAGNINNIP